MAQDWIEQLGFVRWKPHFMGTERLAMTHLNPFRFVMPLSLPVTAAVEPVAEQPEGQKSGGLPYWARPAPAIAPPVRPPEVELRVGFSNHTFTTKTPPQHHGVEYRYHASPEGRYFCPDRYKLSFLLKDVVKDFRNRDCFRAKDENFLIVDLPEMLLEGYEYRIFFNLFPSGTAGALALMIESAYPALLSRDAPSGIREKPLGFRVLANDVLALQNGIPQKQTPP